MGGISVTYSQLFTLGTIHPCKELSINTQQGEGFITSSVGTRLEMAPGGSHLNCCFLWTIPFLHELKVCDKPLDSQHQHKELAWRMAHSWATPQDWLCSSIISYVVLSKWPKLFKLISIFSNQELLMLALMIYTWHRSIKEKEVPKEKDASTVLPLGATGHVT